MRLRPDPCNGRRLDRLLRQPLLEDDQGEVEEHLLSCASCRAKLDELAGGARWWAAVRQHLGSEAESGLSATSDGAGTRAAADESLDFLQSSDTPGTLGRLGYYEVLEVLGRGGMGVVLKAFDPALHRPVAIKVLAAAYAANGAARKRFAREAQAAAAVSHDHVVPVHAVDANATPPYLVMAFIPGQSLQERLDASGPLELKEILRIGMQTAAGLAAAHAQGLVHRDIKPANIMLENGIERVRITDFGLARAVDDASVSQGGSVAGTPQYMAPEQARGDVVDQRADLFALGSTLYAMATGRAPFRGEGGLAVIRQVCDLEPAPMRSINPDIPGWFEGIVRKLHAKDPGQRFQSAGEVAELLERCLAHVQQPDRQALPGAAEALTPSAGGGKRRFIDGHVGPALAMVFVALVVGAGYVILERFLPGREARIGNGPSVDLRAIPDGIGIPNFDATFDDQTRRLAGSLSELGQNIAAPRPTGGTDLEPMIQEMQRRAAMLNDDLAALPEAGSDQVDARISRIRDEIAHLRRSIQGSVD